MSRINSLCVVCAMSAWALGTGAPAAFGGFAVATLANPKAFDTGNGTFSVNAYSEQNGFGGTAKNSTVTPTVVVNGTTINPSPPNQRNKPGYYVSTNGAYIPVPKDNALGPTARLVQNNGSAFGKSTWLKKAGDQVTITSTTGAFQGQASAFINPSGERLLFAKASENTPNGVINFFRGKAAGQAADPFFVPSSSAPLTYDPVLNDSIQLVKGESGGAVSWAVDSSVFTSDSVDNFVQDGAPLDQSLWFLAISAQGPISSTSGVSIDFEINPLALNEIAFPSSFLAGLGSYSNPASEAALINQAIDQTVASALTLNGKEVDLSGFNPFPTGTTFTAANGGVEYADGVNAEISGAGAGISGVPEPSSLVLLSLGGGCVWCFAARRRRRGNISPAAGIVCSGGLFLLLRTKALEDGADHR